MRYRRGDVSTAKQTRVRCKREVPANGRAAGNYYSVILRSARSQYAAGRLKRTDIVDGIRSTRVYHAKRHRNGFTRIDHAVCRQTAFADERHCSRSKKGHAHDAKIDGVCSSVNYRGRTAAAGCGTVVP